MTGGAGVVGSYLVRELVKRGDRPLVLDTRAGPRFLAEFGGGAELVAADVTELAPLIDLFRHLRVEVVAHLAALTGSRAPDQPMVQFRVNMEGTMNILEAARLAGVRRVIMASTRTVYPDFEGSPYGPPEYRPVPEDHPLCPDRPYEIWKQAGERIGRHYRERFGIEFAAFRFAPYYAAEWAERARLGGQRVMGQVHGLIHHASRSLPATLPGGADRPLDLIYVRDLAAGLVRALDARELPSSAYNLGSGSLVTVRALCEALLRLRPQAQLAVGPGQDFAEGHYCLLDSSRAASELGFRPRFPLERGLQDCLERLAGFGSVRGSA